MKVIIIGKGRGWEDAPMDGFTWGIKDLLLRRLVTLVFDMHECPRNTPLEEAKQAITRHRAKTLGIPLICLENYPLEAIMKKFDTDYFSNSIDYALAYAIYQGFSEIDLYGVNMEVSSEYAYEKPGVDFWCGMAKGRGIKVTVYGEHSTMMKTRDGLLYGYNIPQTGRVYEKEDNRAEGLCVGNCPS